MTDIPLRSLQTSKHEHVSHVTGQNWQWKVQPLVMAPNTDATAAGECSKWTIWSDDAIWNKSFAAAAAARVIECVSPVTLRSHCRRVAAFFAIFVEMVSVQLFPFDRLIHRFEAMRMSLMLTSTGAASIYKMNIVAVHCLCHAIVTWVFSWNVSIKYPKIRNEFFMFAARQWFSPFHW